MLNKVIALGCVVWFLAGCSEKSVEPVKAKVKEGSVVSHTSSSESSTCTGAYPGYFQDPAFAGSGMWDNEVIINQPPAGWQGPVFELSDAYSRAVAENNMPWKQFNPFDPNLGEAEKTEQAQKYIWAVMTYMQEGNIGNNNVNDDWTLCDNPIRSWFHIPYQTYDPMSGREFVHGLTREAPVTTTINGDTDLKTTMWAVGFYNPAAAQSISEVWTGAPAPVIPQQNFHFNNGSVIGKLLFTTASPTEYPFLKNLPSWQANISAPEFCTCTPSEGSECSFKEETEQCPRTVSDVYLLQFDIAVRDERSPVGWAYGTFVADGERKSNEANPWNRISALGLMWGNDTPPVGTGAAYSPNDPRKNGFKDGAIFWDVVDMLNEHTNAGHLGCNDRLNGPADNAQSSCLSCHQTASVPDMKNTSPAILYQFGGFDNNNGQCMTEPDQLDLDIDQVYFKSFSCSESFTGPANIVPPPKYASGHKDWISTDFSLQLSISLTQWQAWNRHRKVQEKNASRVIDDDSLPAR